MAASRQVGIPFYRGKGRQRGRVFGALAQVIGRTANPLLCEYSAQLQNACVLTCCFLLRQKFQKLLAVEKTSRQQLKKWADKLWENNGIVVATERECAQNHSKEICRINVLVATRYFYKHFSLIISNKFRYQAFDAVSGNLGRKTE